MGEKKRRAKAGYFGGMKHSPGPRIVTDRLTKEERADCVARTLRTTELAGAAGSGTEWIKLQFKSDIVWGIWRDPAAPEGWQIAIMRGWGLLHLVSQLKNDIMKKQSGVIFENVAHAHAAFDLFGDGRQVASN